MRKILTDKGLMEKMALLSLIFIAFCLLIFVLNKFQTIFKPIALSILFLTIFAPFVRGGQNNLIKNLKVLLIIFSLIAATFLTTFFINNEVQNYLSGANNIINFKEFPLAKFIDLEQINLNSQILILVESLSSFASQFILTMILLIFITPAYNHLIKYNTKFRQRILKIENKIKIYFKTKILVSLATAALTAIVLYLFNVDLILTLILMTFILNFIPNIGSILSVVLASIVYFLGFGIDNHFFIFLSLLIALQFLIGSILDPKLSANVLKVSPLLVISSLLFWGSVWGIVGALISVPLTMTFKIIFESIQEDLYTS